MAKQRIKAISTLSTVIIAILPALNVQRSIIPQVELGTFLLVLLVLPMICFYPKITLGKEEWSWLVFLFVCLFFTTVSVFMQRLSGNAIYTIALRYLKVFAAVVIVIIIGKNYFNIDLALKANLIVTYLCILLIIAQTIFGKEFIGYSSSEAGPIRPSGFFYEPSNFASFAIVGLIYLLTAKNIKYRPLQIAIVAGGIVLSTSGTGLILLPIITAFYFLLTLRCRIGRTRKHILILMWTLIFIVLFVVIYINTPIGQRTMSRLIKADGTLNNAITGRLQSGAAGIFGQLNTLYRWIGCGFGNRPDTVYFSSFYAVLYGDGIIGLGLLLYVIFGYYKKGGVYQKLLCITYVILLYSTGIFNFGSTGLYFAFAGASSSELR